MMDLSAIAKRLSKLRHPDAQDKSSRVDKCGTSEVQNPLGLDSNDAIAMVAYSEVLETMSIKSELIDSMLVEELSSAIDGCQETRALINSRSVSKALLPKAKEVIHDYYVTTRQGSEHHVDTCRLTHEEFDVDLLQSLTHVYAKSFIRRYYCP